MKQPKTQLHSLGLSDLEIDIYLKLLEIGPSSLSKLTNTLVKPKTTVFENTKKLLEKGLVVKTVKGKSFLLTARKPERINSLIARIESDLVQKQHDLDQIKLQASDMIASIKEIAGNDDATKVETKFRLYEGKSEVFNVYQEVFEADEVFSFANLENYYQVFPDTRFLWKEAFEKNRNRIYWDILIDTPMARKMKKQKSDRYFVKILPSRKNDNVYTFSDCMIYNDKVAMIQLSKRNVFASVIKSKHIANSMIAIHQFVWALLPD